MAGDVLVIGFGNTLRGDDGIGPAVAAAIAELALPDVRVLAVHQLTPELAAELAEVRRVVFVDAAAGGEAVTVSPITAESVSHALTHTTDPRALLALTRAAYGSIPEAWLVTVPGAEFGFREGLTEAARERDREATGVVHRLISDRSRPG